MVARSLRWARGEVPFVLTVAVLAAGLVTTGCMHDDWRPGTAVIGAALVLAALLRLLLPASRAGLLVVRARWWDVVCYLVAGGLVLALDIRLR